MTASSSVPAGAVHSPACGAGLIDVHHQIVPPFYLAEQRAQIAGARGGEISLAWLHWAPELAGAEMDAHGVAMAMLASRRIAFGLRSPPARRAMQFTPARGLRPMPESAPGE